MTLNDPELPKQCPKCQCTTTRGCLFYRHNGFPIKNKILNTYFSSWAVSHCNSSYGRSWSSKLSARTQLASSSGYSIHRTRPKKVCVLFLKTFPSTTMDLFGLVNWFSIFKLNIGLRWYCLIPYNSPLPEEARMENAMYRPIFMWF